MFADLNRHVCILVHSHPSLQDLLPLLLTSDDEFFALALIQTMPEEKVFAVARDIRRASRNYNDVLKLSNILLKVAHSKGT